MIITNENLFMVHKNIITYIFSITFSIKKWLYIFFYITLNSRSNIQTDIKKCAAQNLK